MKELLSNKVMKKVNVIVTYTWDENEFGYNMLYNSIFDAINKKYNKNFIKRAANAWWLGEVFCIKMLIVFKNGDKKTYFVYWDETFKRIFIDDFEGKLFDKKILKKNFINNIEKINSIH